VVEETWQEGNGSPNGGVVGPLPRPFGALGRWVMAGV
jgi:hypothetical protein